MPQFHGVLIDSELEKKNLFAAKLLNIAWITA